MWCRYDENWDCRLWGDSPDYSFHAWWASCNKIYHMNNDWAKKMERELFPPKPEDAQTLAQLTKNWPCGPSTKERLIKARLGKTLERGRFGSCFYYWPKK